MMLEIDRITVCYAPVVLLEDVSIKIAEGEIVFLSRMRMDHRYMQIVDMS